MEKIKILNYEDKSNSGVIIKSQNLNSERIIILMH